MYRNKSKFAFSTVLIAVPAVLALFFGLSPVPAAAETVMVYTDIDGGKGAVKESRGYLEDGIMDTFFEAGHIIFNAFPEMAENTEEPEGFSERFSVRTAKSGGATLLLEIGMSFSSDEEEPLPVSASYEFYEINSGRLLSDGSVSLSEVNNRDELEDKEIVQELGRVLALGALRGM